MIGWRGVTSLALPETVLGHAVDGILGSDFIRRYVVELDYANRMLTLYEPQTYYARPHNAGATLALQIVNDNPCVTARLKLPGVEALDALFAIDTGDGGGGLGLNTHFVKRHKLLEIMSLKVPGFAAGLSGESRTMAGRAESLLLAGATLREPIVGFSQSERGAHARTDFDGLLSAEIWRRFRVTLDYRRRQLRLAPNDSLRDPFESDMSGLLFAAEGTDFKTLRISQVRRDSPAELAGLREGDVLLALDEQPVAGLSLFQVEQKLKEDGREIRLRVRRNADLVQVRLRLKRVI